MMNFILPDWLDQVQGVDFAPEKELLRDLEEWASANDWEVSDGRKLSTELRQRTDVLLSHPDGKRTLRVAVLTKARNRSGVVRIDADSNDPFIHRVFELVYQPRPGRWRVELSTYPLCDDVGAEDKGWSWLADIAFKP